MTFNVVGKLREVDSTRASYHLTFAFFTPDRRSLGEFDFAIEALSRSLRRFHVSSGEKIGFDFLAEIIPPEKFAEQINALSQPTRDLFGIAWVLSRGPMLDAISDRIKGAVAPDKLVEFDFLIRYEPSDTNEIQRLKDFLGF